MIDNILSEKRSGYKPSDQQALTDILSAGDVKSLAQLQKETGFSRSTIFEATNDLASADLITTHRSNANITFDPDPSGLSIAVAPVVPPGRVVFGSLPGKYDGEQRGERPAVVVSDYSVPSQNALLIVPLTSNCDKPPEGTVRIEETDRNGLSKDSMALCNNVKTVSKTQVDTIFDTVDAQFGKVQAELREVLALAECRR